MNATNDVVIGASHDIAVIQPVLQSYGRAKFRSTATIWIKCPNAHRIGAHTPSSRDERYQIDLLSVELSNHAELTLTRSHEAPPTSRAPRGSTCHLSSRRGHISPHISDFANLEDPSAHSDSDSTIPVLNFIKLSHLGVGLPKYRRAILSLYIDSQTFDYEHECPGAIRYDQCHLSRVDCHVAPLQHGGHSPADIDRDVDVQGDVHMGRRNRVNRDCGESDRRTCGGFSSAVDRGFQCLEGEVEERVNEGRWSGQGIRQMNSHAAIGCKNVKP